MLAWLYRLIDGPRVRVILCPFHSELTPSCCVDLVTARWHCFGCGKTGDLRDLPSEVHL